ncbi:MAG: methylmalonyl-CoA epimerase [Chloroflexota bacterium]
MTKRLLNHVGIVAEDLQAALKFWRDGLGMSVKHEELNEEEEVEIVFINAGEQSTIELISPTTPDSGIAKYMAKRGAGQHHVCIEVDDINAVMDDLVAKGFELINEKPRTRPDGTLYAFTHPKSTGGVMVELYQNPEA